MSVVCANESHYKNSLWDQTIIIPLKVFAFMDGIVVHNLSERVVRYSYNSQFFLTFKSNVKMIFIYKTMVFKAVGIFLKCILNYNLFLSKISDLKYLHIIKSSLWIKVYSVLCLSFFWGLFSLCDPLISILLSEMFHNQKIVWKNRDRKGSNMYRTPLICPTLSLLYLIAS